MSGIKLDGTGGTDAILHYFPLRRVMGMILLEDQAAECFCLDVMIAVGEDPDLGDIAQFTIYSDSDLLKVVAFADALSERLWGELIDVGAMKPAVEEKAGDEA